MKANSGRLHRATATQLRAFQMAARHLSVTRAAEALHLSQPTVSVQLRQLAELVGEPLFETLGRKLRLTPAGQLLQHTVTDIADCWERFDAQRAELQGLLRGRLRIAAVTTAEYFVPNLLGPFAAEHPSVEIELVVENKDRVVERLRAGSDDLSVMMLAPPQLPLHQRPFLDNPLVVVAAADHPMQGRRLRLRDLSSQRWLMREQGSGTRSVAESHFRAREFEPRVAMSLGSNEAIKHAVAAGLGIAVLSRLALAAGADGLAELTVSGFPLKRQWSVVWRKDRGLSRAATRFVEYLQGRQTHTASP